MHIARLICCLPALTAVITSPAHAAQWYAEPGVYLDTGYNDNIRFTTAPHDSVWETILTPELQLGVLRENQGIFGNVDVAIRRYAGGSGRESSSVLDREEYHLGTTAFHNTLRDAFRVNTDYTRDNTLDSQFDESGDIVSQSATRSRWSLGPSWIHALNERTRLSVGGQYTTVSYTNEPPDSNLVNYDNYSVSASLTRQFHPRLQGTLTTAYSSFEPDTGFNSETVSVQAGLSGSISETVTASILAGQRQTTSDTLVATGFCLGADPGAGFPDCTGGIAVPTGTAEDQTDNTGSVYSAGITKVLEDGSLSASISRSSNPNNQGDLLDTTRLVLTGLHKFTETLSAEMKISYNERETIVNRVGRDSNQGKRKTFRITPRIAWQWRREWKIGAEYRYAKNEDESSRKAKQSAVYMTLAYQPAKVYVSR